MERNHRLAQAIVFSSLLVAGTLLFAVVSVFRLDWFLPSMLMIVATAIGWDHFINQRAHEDRGEEVTFGKFFEDDDAPAFVASDLDFYSETLKTQFAPMGGGFVTMMPESSDEFKVGRGKRKSKAAT